MAGGWLAAGSDSNSETVAVLMGRSAARATGRMGSGPGLVAYTPVWGIIPIAGLDKKCTALPWG